MRGAVGRDRKRTEGALELGKVILDKDIVPFESIQTDNKTVQKIITNHHNHIRRHVDPPAANMLKMEWSPILAESAKKWADCCYLNHSTVKHRTLKGSACGENILTSPVPMSWKTVINRWEAEKKFLYFGVGAAVGKVIGHFTQLVADNTYQVGCATAYCGDYFYVCHYYTAGNEPETLYTPYKPGKPCSECKKACDGNKLCLNYCPFANLASNCIKAIYYDLCHFHDVKRQCRTACECKGKIK
ncbi:cysteine-rich venom protein-like [Hyla sarda]|uniref:cysteine-rich venom protein-like n=1 Tax=Hyla sarda TaxID=327740 RepID=UPI0024C2DE62|nr:cysteine-rich venom protein-like [Hyla sarda]